MLVKSPRFVILRMNGKGANTCDIGRLKGPFHCIFENARANAPALPVTRSGKPGETLREPLGSIAAFDLPHHSTT